MAVQQRTINIILFSLLGLGLIIGITTLIATFIRAGETPPATPDNPNPQPLGFGGAFASIIAQAGGFFKGLFGGQCDPNRWGYTKDGQYKPDKCGSATVNCDPNRSGYEINGTPNANCLKDYSGCDYNKCDPNRSGWNECGFPDNRC